MKTRSIPEDLLAQVHWSNRNDLRSGVRAVYRMYMRNRDKRIGPKERPYSKSEIWNACIGFHFRDKAARQSFERERARIRDEKIATRALAKQELLRKQLAHGTQGELF